MPKNDVLIALFALIESVLRGECGDGDAHVHCKYRDKTEVAQLFEALAQGTAPRPPGESSHVPG